VSFILLPWISMNEIKWKLIWVRKIFFHCISMITDRIKLLLMYIFVTGILFLLKTLFSTMWFLFQIVPAKVECGMWNMCHWGDVAAGTQHLDVTILPLWEWGRWQLLTLLPSLTLYVTYSFSCKLLMIKLIRILSK